MTSIIIGTAGHIDHGKSALVRALTGTDPDRLPEEKKRGITIDLGFADLDLDGVQFGFVDVPGHERFVKNMLAGAHGIDLMALVIAADEGVMPQTIEHLDICSLLDVRQGLIVITKSDLVDADMLSLVEEEAKELSSGTFLEDAPIISVSSKTGAGLDRLRSTLVEIAGRVPSRSADLIVRLPIDRAFSMKGFGAVVTGTLISGEIREADELELLPVGTKVRVRGLQVHGKSVTRAEAGQRTAVNLGGVDVSQLQRGMVLSEQKLLRPTQIFDAHIDILQHASKGVKSRSRLRLHVGAAEVLGRVRILDLPAELTPGQSGLAQFRLEMPIAIVHGDRFIIRSYSPAITIAGGVVLDPFATKHRGKEIETTRQRLRNLLSANRTDKVSAFVESSALRGCKVEDLVALTGWKKGVAKQAVLEAQAEGKIVEAGEILISQQNLDRICRKTTTELESHHKREPLARGMLRETLRERVFTHSLPELFGVIIEKLEAAGQLVSEKDVIRASSYKVDLSQEDAQLRAKLEQVYRDAGVEAPLPDEAMARAGVAAPLRGQARKILQLLIESGAILRVQNELFIHESVIRDLKTKLLAFAAAHEPERLIEVGAFKDLAGVSRKYAIPLLEYFDRERVTRRAGDKRLILPLQK